MRHFFTVAGERHRAWLARRGDGFMLVAERSVGVGLSQIAGPAARLHVGGDVHDVMIAVNGDTAYVHIAGLEIEVRFHSAVDVLGHEAASEGDAVARAPMPGMALSVSTAPGRRVAAGDVLVVIESMKLETAIKAPRDGVVSAVHVTPGESFDRDAPLVTLAAEG